MKQDQINIGSYTVGNKSDIYLFSYSFSDTCENQKTLFGGNASYTPVILSRDDLLIRHDAILFLHQKYLSKARDFFNNYHKTDLSLEYWHYRLSPWLIRQISLFVDRSMKFQKFFLLQKNYLVKVNNMNPFHKLNLVEQSILLNQSIYNYFLSSYLLLKLEIPNVNLEKTSENVLSNPKSVDRNLPSIEFLKFSPNGFLDIECRILKFLFSRGMEVKREVSKVNFRPNDLAKKLEEKLDLFSLLFDIFPSEFYTSPLDQNVVENRFTRSLFLKNFGGAYDFQNKQIATWVEKNPYQVIIHQHGSSYGDHLCSARNYICEYFQNTFISWGWKDHALHPASKIVPLPSPIMAKARWRRLFSRRDNSVVLVSSIVAVNDSNGSTSTHPDQIMDYYNLINEFVRLSVKSNYFKSFYYRPRLTHNEYSFQISKFVIENHPCIKLHTDKYFERAISKVKLAVIDNSGSVLNKVLAANIPTILIWPKGCNFYREDLNDVFMSFEKEGVLFYDAKSAVAHIEKINSDVNAWWFKPEIQKARKKFVNTLCPVDHFYFFKWAWRLATWR